MGRIKNPSRDCHRARTVALPAGLSFGVWPAPQWPSHDRKQKPGCGALKDEPLSALWTLTSVSAVQPGPERRIQRQSWEAGMSMEEESRSERQQ